MMARGHRLANHGSVSFADFAHERLAFPCYAEYAEAVRACLNRPRAGRSDEAWSDTDVQALVAAGEHVSIGPKSLVDGREIVGLPLECFDIRRSVCLLGAAGRARSEP